MIGNALSDVITLLSSCGSVSSEVEVIDCFDEDGTRSSFLTSFSLSTTIPDMFAPGLFFRLGLSKKKDSSYPLPLSSFVLGSFALPGQEEQGA